MPEKIDLKSRPLLPYSAWLLLLLLCGGVFAQGKTLQIHARQPLEDLKFSLDAESKAWLKKKTSLTVGVPAIDYPPYRIITERNELEGIGADYLSALQRELAIQLIVKKFDSMDEAYQALREGRVDMVESSTAFAAKHNQVSISPPYAFTELALFAESGDFHNYNTQASDARIATIGDSFFELYQQAGGQGSMNRYPTPLAAIASVLNGESQLYLGDTFSTRTLLAQFFSNQLVINQSAGLPEIQVGFAYKANDKMLGHVLEQALGGLSRCSLVSAMRVWGDTVGCDMSRFRDRLSKSERAWLDQAGSVRLAVSEDLAPFTFFDNKGRFNGIASELLDIVRLKTGIQFEINRASSLSATEALLKHDKADLSVLTHISSDEGSYLHSRPFVTLPFAIVTRRDEGPIVTLNVDNAETVAVTQGYMPLEVISRHYPNFHVIETATAAEAFNLVRDGKADILLAPVSLARYYLSYKYENSLKINGVLPDDPAQIAFVASQNNPLLISILDKALAEISPAQYTHITGRWRANAATDDRHWEGISTNLWSTLGVLCLLLAIAALLIVTQRRRIIHKQRDLQQRQLILDELQLAKESAEKASRSKTVFLATMSHEIRTPLNAIIGMLELVLTRKNQVELNTQSVHIAYESAHNLLGLIGDILDISRIESGKLTLRPEVYSLKDLIDSVTNVFAGLARQKQLSVRFEMDDTALQRIWIDGLKFKQILSNLLSNAIKFTETGGIVVKCQGRRDGEHSVQFKVSVTDSGQGIPQSQLNQVFTPFFELHSAVNNPNTGAGLGLSISQVLSQLMNARLSVESEVGVGTSMIFSGSFQCVSSDNSDVDNAQEQSTTAHIDGPLNILIVEDHLPSQFLLEQQITYLGHNPLIANNGVEGLRVWWKQDIDIILTDCNMPEISGYELTRTVRSLESELGLEPCTIIGLTADAQPDVLEQCLASGMNEALAKPINLAGLNRFIPTLNNADRAQTHSPASLAKEVQQEIAEHVITSNNEELLALEKALNQQDLKALARIAHKLKGTAYVLNSQSLLQLCLTLEELTESPDKQQQIRGAVAEVTQALKAINVSLHTA